MPMAHTVTAASPTVQLSPYYMLYLVPFLSRSILNLPPKLEHEANIQSIRLLLSASKLGVRTVRVHDRKYVD